LLGDEISKTAEKWVIEKIKNFAEKFKNKKLVTFGNKKIEERVKNSEKSTEFKFYKNYIKEIELSSLLKMGIIFKNLEREQDFTTIFKLKEKLIRKSKEDLWFVQLIQNNLLKKYIDILIDKDYSIEEIIEKIKYVKDNSLKFCFFIQEKDTEELIKKEIFRLMSSKPEILLISSKGNVAKNFKKIKENIILQYKNHYSFKLEEDENKILLIFIEILK
jgi:hypothetical protein